MTYGKISIVRQIEPEARRPYRLIELYYTSEGPRTRVVSGTYATIEEARTQREILNSPLYDTQEEVK